MHIFLYCNLSSYLNIWHIFSAGIYFALFFIVSILSEYISESWDQTILSLSRAPQTLQVNNKVLSQVIFAERSDDSVQEFIKKKLLEVYLTFVPCNTFLRDIIHTKALMSTSCISGSEYIKCMKFIYIKLENPQIGMVVFPRFKFSRCS